MLNRTCLQSFLARACFYIHLGQGTFIRALHQAIRELDERFAHAPKSKQGLDLDFELGDRLVHIHDESTQLKTIQGNQFHRLFR